MAWKKMIPRVKMKVPKRHRSLKIPDSYRVFTVRLTLAPNLAEQFERTADNSERSASSLLSYIVSKYLREHQSSQEIP